MSLGVEMEHYTVSTCNIYLMYFAEVIQINVVFELEGRAIEIMDLFGKMTELMTVHCVTATFNIRLEVVPRTVEGFLTWWFLG